MPDGYNLCGWRVASEIPLPDLAAWSGSSCAPDIIVALGEAPPFDAPVMTTPLVAIDEAGRARFTVPGVADYLVEGGSRITVAPARAIDSADIRLFLLGSGLGYLCHQRGVLPVHGATVDVDGEAVMLAGASGAGKSTLADAFARRGHAVLSDDVSPIEIAPGGARVLPSLRRIRLWKDAIDHAGWDVSTLDRCRQGMDKFSRPLRDATPVTPLPPRAIFHLRSQWAKLGAPKFARLHGRGAADEFRRQVYRWRSLVGMAGAQAAVARSVLGAAAIPAHFTIERGLGLERLDALVDQIVQTVRASR